MTLEEFEKLVADAIALIPARIQKHMNNVAFVVEQESRKKRVGERPIVRGEILLGLYEGVPMTRRGINYSLVLPDKITIFQKPLEELAQGNADRLQKLVGETVHHEIAHHLGMNEREVRAWESKRLKRKRET